MEFPPKRFAKHELIRGEVAPALDPQHCLIDCSYQPLVDRSIHWNGITAFLLFRLPRGLAQTLRRILRDGHLYQGRPQRLTFGEASKEQDVVPSRQSARRARER